MTFFVLGKCFRMKNPQEFLRSLGAQECFFWRDPPGAYYDWHTHPQDQWHWVVEGVMEVWFQDQHHLLYPGHLLFVPAFKPHKARTREGASYWVGVLPSGSRSEA